MGKVGNALLMLRILESGRKYSVDELAERLEITPRMVKIYKEELEKSGIFIETIRGKYGGYVYHNKHNYNVSFNYLDLDAIENIMDKLSKKEKEKINITLEKIRSIVIYSIDEERNIKIDKQDIQNKYLLISKAIQDNKKLLFKYHNKWREFVPQTFTYYKDYIYITGYSVLEDDIKTLNLSKINDLTIK